MIGDTPYRTIQSAIDAAPSGHEVGVCPGRWAESLVVDDQWLILYGVSGDPVDTVLDGECERQILSAESSKISISDLTFARGYEVVEHPEESPGGEGGAIYAEDTELELSGCVFTDNEAGAGGGAVYLDYDASTKATVEDCRFERNQAREGGALFVYAPGRYSNAEVTVTSSTFEDNQGGAVSWDGGDRGTLTIEDCDFTSNSSDRDGGALSSDSKRLVVSDSTFVSNRSAKDGGAIDAAYRGDEEGTVSISHSHFVANEARHGGALELGGAEVTVAACHFKGNMALEHSGVLNLVGGGLTFTDTTFVANEANRAYGYVGSTPYGAVLGASSKVEHCSITLEDSALTSNTAHATYGAAVVLPEGCALHSVHTNWGTGSTENIAFDLCSFSGCTDTLGEDESFSCPAKWGC